MEYQNKTEGNVVVANYMDSNSSFQEFNLNKKNQNKDSSKKNTSNQITKNENKTSPNLSKISNLPPLKIKIENLTKQEDKEKEKRQLTKTEEILK